jgi:hypothetical protein
MVAYVVLVTAQAQSSALMDVEKVCIVVARANRELRPKLQSKVLVKLMMLYHLAQVVELVVRFAA